MPRGWAGHGWQGTGDTSVGTRRGVQRGAVGASALVLPKSFGSWAGMGTGRSWNRRRAAPTALPALGQIQSRPGARILRAGDSPQLGMTE